MPFKSFLKSLGPGLITGASDDDPSGIATFSQAGAQFGYNILWLAPFQYPLMVVIQEMCARIGLLTGNGLSAIIKKKYSKRIVMPLIFLLFIANTINSGADINAMAASINLLVPQIPSHIFSVLLTVAIISANILIPYKKYVKILKYLTISLFSYVVTSIIVGGNWNQILFSSLIPHFEYSSDFAMMFVAILGTSISPYLFFWQASEEVEEQVLKKKIKDFGKGKPLITKREIKSMRLDILVGLGFSLFIVWSIIITAAGTLFINGITNIQSADQAAKAIEPLVKSFPNAGDIAKAIFAVGIIGTGLLSIPVLAGSSAYAISDIFGWKQGLSKKFGQAKAFYLIITISAIIGLSINFVGINPIKALIYTAVINGVVSIPIIFIIMKIANDKKILGDNINNNISNVIGWFTFILMTISVFVMFVSWLR